MLNALIPSDAAEVSVPIHLIGSGDVETALANLPATARQWAETNGFKGSAGEVLVAPNSEGRPAAVLFGTGLDKHLGLLAGRLASALPAGDYRFAEPMEDLELATLAFVLGSYRFDRYLESAVPRPRLAVPAGVHVERVSRVADGVYLARDLINTPSNDMGPADLEAAARQLATAFDARIDVTVGSELVENGFPLIHAVGRASDRAPRLIDLTWNGAGAAADAPKVTLVGKGVCFDTGGLDIKPASGMLLMKKDMGGAAATIGLASMIMDTGLPVRLRLLIPAVENAISGSAFRPGDILRSRKGLTVEIGNTDAEGRLVLADALALADDEAPDLIIDMATLTGAARVAMGPEVVPFFTHDDAMAEALARHADAVADPVWRLPLHAPYQQMLKSSVADLNNTGSGPFAGCITAALFMSRFVEKATTWMHFDIYGWVPKTRPGQPEGGEAQAVRALFAMLEERYAE